MQWANFRLTLNKKKKKTTKNTLIQRPNRQPIRIHS